MKSHQPTSDTTFDEHHFPFAHFSNDLIGTPPTPERIEFKRLREAIRSANTCVKDVGHFFAPIEALAKASPYWKVKALHLLFLLGEECARHCLSRSFCTRDPNENVSLDASLTSYEQVSGEIFLDKSLYGGYEVARRDHAHQFEHIDALACYFAKSAWADGAENFDSADDRIMFKKSRLWVFFSAVGTMKMGVADLLEYLEEHDRRHSILDKALRGRVPRELHNMMFCKVFGSTAYRRAANFNESTKRRRFHKTGRKIWSWESDHTQSIIEQVGRGVLLLDKGFWWDSAVECQCELCYAGYGKDLKGDTEYDSEDWEW